MHQNPGIRAQHFPQRHNASQDAIAPALAAGTGTQRFIAPHFHALPTVITGGQRKHDAMDIRVLCQQIKNVFDHRLAKQWPVLLGNIAA
jgi:hypothetical protein